MFYLNLDFSILNTTLMWLKCILILYKKKSRLFNTNAIHLLKHLSVPFTKTVQCIFEEVANVRYIVPRLDFNLLHIYQLHSAFTSIQNEYMYVTAFALTHMHNVATTSRDINIFQEKVMEQSISISIIYQRMAMTKKATN